MKIRQATAADIDTMSMLLGQLFSIEQDFTPDHMKQRTGLEKLLAMQDAYLVVAEDEDEVVGMATLQLLISTAEGGRCGLIEDLVVSESYRGRGIGQALLEHLIQWADKKGLTRLQLLADRDNQSALAFYKKQGWSTTKLIALRKITG
ncbi:MAG: GNAT family N-acetyltransferase [Candidatus Thiodiazotropha sp. (ex Ctena orbiculata)]|nr:GNAT family N-acetyltransferase [Candidatus Thiodiazotropha taylori]MBT2998045.1 GNAT family N-acetyltransferase [Candidatus Thiodiazotropha taylori]MBT3002256.1 GNAT family N-acetyltransferase [Candidatus Thiodiazotropha taylori]MBV2109257.1 GNAT family N-acetyltransferase [Candidatus Thiodiazotropha taylori]MBV2112644.1 GNAT family N-acetyltransferase [Candidatus Thiodiazotropha taylori]